MLDSDSIRNLFPLQGEKVTLHLFSENHINDRYLSWLNDPEVVRYSNQRFKIHDYNSCRAYLESFHATGNLFLAIHVKDGGQFIGTMTAFFSTPHRTVDMGILIGDKAFWKKGMGQEAWELLMLFLLGLNEVRKVTGGTLRCNLGMVNIMIKAGMQPDGVRIAHELVDNNPHDIIHFARFNNV
jgi:ribosomal-protein-alanine N-acetyltransferase